MAKTYKVIAKLPGYYTSASAMAGSDARNTVKPGTYYIFNEANGAINVTSVEGQPGSWINPTKNVKPDNIVTHNKEEGTKKSSKKKKSKTNKTYADSTTPNLDSSKGSNKKVYSPDKDYIPCYVINSLLDKTIEFECEPEEFSESNSAQFDAQDIRGRSSPYQGYGGSGPREINFSVTLHDDLCKNGILSTVNRLKSLTYPNYDGVLKAPSSKIRIGDMINCNAIITEISVNWKKPYRDGVYVNADVDINAIEVVDEAFSSSDIWSKGGYI